MKTAPRRRSGMLRDLRASGFQSRAERSLSGSVETAKLIELRHEPGRHPLDGARSHVLAQALLEAVAPCAVVTSREVPFRFLPLDVSESSVQEVLEKLLAAIAGVAAHVKASSARCCFSARRPRWRRDITVPIGTSRICAASAYVKSPMSTSTTTSRNWGGISESAFTTESCDKRSTTSSVSRTASPAADPILFPT